MAYAAVGDLLKGDIPLPVRWGNGQGILDMTAEEIDAQIGHIYITPVALSESPEDRPARLLLKKINQMLASGRLVIDLAAAGEDRELHAYGASMVMEATGLLNRISSGEIILTGADRVEKTGTQQFTGPRLYNEDETSRVEDFYKRYKLPLVLPRRYSESQVLW